jgi:hypothetical protein
MKTPLDHIEHLRTKPSHVRRKVALLVSFLVGTTFLLTWFSYERAKLAVVIPNEAASYADGNNNDTSFNSLNAAASFQAVSQ